MAPDTNVLQNLLRSEELDAVLACRPWETTFQPNVHYLLGHLLPPWNYSGLFVLLRGDGPPVAVTNAWCPPDPTGQVEVRTYPGYHMRFALPVLAATLQDLGLARARLGIESTTLPIALFDQLRASNPGVTFVAGDRVFARLRLRKSPAEVTAIRRAIRAAEDAITAAVAALKTSRRLVDVEAAARAVSSPDSGQSLKAHGTIYRPDGSEIVDPPPLLAAGTVLTLDVVSVHDFYRADMARQIVSGDPPQEILSRMDAVVALQDAMIGAMRPGLSLHDAYNAAIRAASPWASADPSFTFQFHSIGLETHEPPRFCSPNAPYFPLPDAEAPDPDNVPLDQPMVASLELGVGGAWTEDVFLLTAGGAERLTTLPRRILAP